MADGRNRGKYVTPSAVDCNYGAKLIRIAASGPADGNARLSVAAGPLDCAWDDDGNTAGAE